MAEYHSFTRVKKRVSKQFCHQTVDYFQFDEAAYFHVEPCRVLASHFPSHFNLEIVVAGKMHDIKLDELAE